MAAVVAFVFRAGEHTLLAIVVNHRVSENALILAAQARPHFLLQQGSHLLHIEIYFGDISGREQLEIRQLLSTAQCFIF